MSCGYYPKNGRVCPRAAVKAAEEIGVDLTQHRSCIITKEMVRQADVIFTFDEENRKTLMTHYPLAQQKVHRLGLLAPEAPLAIRDPYGGNVDVFKTTYQTIMQILNANVIDSKFQSKWYEKR